MDTKINIAEILKDCPKGTKLYSPIFGEVEFLGIKEDSSFPIKIKCKSFKDSFREDFYRKDGSYCYPGECLLFPSKDQRDWNKFKPKKPKFDPKTLQPFDKVLVRDYHNDKWVCSIFSHIELGDSFHYACILELNCKYCIPYNKDTKHLINKNEEAPEYYRYWED